MHTTSELAGKVAIVTGAGRGLGRAHALALAKAGAAVVVNDLGGGFRGDGEPDSGPADEVTAAIVALGGTALADCSSAADWDLVRALVERTVQHFGRLDIVVNNAGICRFGITGEMSRTDWDLTIATNLTGPAALCHWAAEYWRRVGPQAGRAIVNTTSPAGTNPVAGSPSYCASKAGIAALTIAAAAELAPLGVRVNAIAPMARTRMTLAVSAHDEAMQAVAGGFDRVSPEHVAPLVVYLASSQCRFTGRVFGIEGDDLYLFDGWSAERHCNNQQRSWTLQALDVALSGVETQDRGWYIAPSQRLAGPSPSDQTLAALERLERTDS